MSAAVSPESAEHSERPLRWQVYLRWVDGRLTSVVTASPAQLPGYERFHVLAMMPVPTVRSHPGWTRAA